MKLLDDDQLEQSGIVANCRMNRERSLTGSNGYARELGFDPIEDVEHLDERRAKVGMPPMSVYLCVMRGIYGRDLPDPRLRRR